MTDIPLADPGVPAAGRAGLPTDAIMLWFAGPARQRRWTVLIRLILFIPQYILIGALGVAAAVVAAIGWFAALALGQLPAWAAGFLTGWLRWSTRALAYGWLLTDKYPPFSLDDADYPVRLAAAPGRLNRLAVLFRLILVIPAALVQVFAVMGIGGAMFIIWLIVLITGQMPAPLYQALAATLRMQARYSGYYYLLTGSYPWWGLFGDKPELGAPPAYAAGPAAPAWGPPPPAPPAYGQPGYGQPGYGQPGYGQPGYAAADAGTGTTRLPSPSADPQGWRLVLSGGAKNLLIVFVALGAVIWAGAVTYDITLLHSGVQRVNAISAVSQARNKLGGTMNALQGQVSSCGTNLSCITSQEGKAGQAFTTFGSVLRSTAMPNAAATTAAANLDRDAAQIAADFQRLSTASSPAEYQQILASSNLQQTLAQFNSDYQQLGVTLGAVKG